MIFPPLDKPKKKLRSQHAKGQEGSELKVNQVPSTGEEDKTEVGQEEEEEEAIVKPAAEGTGIPYETRPSQSTIKSNSNYPRNWFSFGFLNGLPDFKINKKCSK